LVLVREQHVDPRGELEDAVGARAADQLGRRDVDRRPLGLRALDRGACGVARVVVEQGIARDEDGARLQAPRQVAPGQARSRAPPRARGARRGGRRLWGPRGGRPAPRPPGSAAPPPAPAGPEPIRPMTPARAPSLAAQTAAFSAEPPPRTRTSECTDAAGPAA